MKYMDRKTFDKANIFGTGTENEMFAAYFTGNSYLKLLVKPGETPLFLANVTFEPGCRNHWHIHQAKSGGGQMLLCTAGEGWYQEEGKKAVELHEGSFVSIPAGVKHWHGAKSDSWFSHISIEVPGEEVKNEWLDPVSDQSYSSLKEKKRHSPVSYGIPKSRSMTKKQFSKLNMFGTGIFNFMLAKYFVGRSYLKMLTMPGRSPLFLVNVTFEPGCRNDWHTHHATSGGGQMLICTSGEGWYQEEGKEPVSLKEGSFVYIPAEVKHWHGAKKESWFSHIALELSGENLKNEWQGHVTDAQYNPL